MPLAKLPPLKPARALAAAPPGLPLVPDGVYAESTIVHGLGLGARTLAKAVGRGDLAAPHFFDGRRHWLGRELLAWVATWPRRDGRGNLPGG